MTTLAERVAETCINTYTDKVIHPLEPKLDQIDIQDIAVGLSRECRFGKQGLLFYPVAQHCILASYLVPDNMRLSALLHDAAEAYLGDMPSPIKQMLPQYKIMESRIMACVCEKFDINWVAPSVKYADNLLLHWEAVHQLNPVKEQWICMRKVEECFVKLPKCYMEFKPMTIRGSELAFMERYWEIVRSE